MFIFGGFDGNKWLNDIYILDIAKLEESTIARETVNSLISNLKSMINNPLMSDISFIVQDCEIYAHKCILVSQSAHFKAMFLSGMNES